MKKMKGFITKRFTVGACACLLVLIHLVAPRPCRGNEKELEVESLKPMWILPQLESEGDVYFRTLPFIAVDDEQHVYAAINLDNKIFKMDRKGKYLGNIGRRGKGPGDIWLPYRVAAAADKFIVADNFAVSVFSSNGQFLDKFKKFQHFEDIAVTTDRIYTLVPDNEQLITVYDYRGKRLQRFGAKPALDYTLHKNLSREFIDRLVFRGRLAVGDNAVYMASCGLGKISKYDLTGNLVRKQPVAFPPKGLIAPIIERFKEKCFKKGFPVEKNGGGVQVSEVIDDLCFAEGKLYVLARTFYKKKNHGEIFQVNAQTLETEKKLIFYNIRQPDAPLNTMKMAVKSYQGELYFYIGISDKGLSKEIYIGLYKLDR